jgi:hypothetical protein
MSDPNSASLGPPEPVSDAERLRRDLAVHRALVEVLRRALSDLHREMLGLPPTIAYDNDYESSELCRQVRTALAQAQRLGSSGDEPK